MQGEEPGSAAALVEELLWRGTVEDRSQLLKNFPGVLGQLFSIIYACPGLDSLARPRPAYLALTYLSLVGSSEEVRGLVLAGMSVASPTDDASVQQLGIGAKAVSELQRMLIVRVTHGMGTEAMEADMLVRRGKD